MQPATPVQVVRVPADRVVEACPCNADDDEDALPPLAVKKPVEYVRLDAWEPPPSVKEIEARIEPRGNKAPDYVRLPSLTLHREIPPATMARRMYYWR